MIATGNFLFKYRNVLFPLVYLLVFVPSPSFLPNWRLALALGLALAVLGQVVRALSIGLVYIKRGGRKKQFYADELVTEGLFAHCRNPLYLGNLLIVFGVGVALNSLAFVVLGGGLFLFAYRAIVRGEEHFLRQKFGEQFDAYCERVPRFIPSLRGIHQTLRQHRFRWKRLIVKEYGSTFVWVAGLLVGGLYRVYRSAPAIARAEEIRFLWILLAGATVAYSVARALKKTGTLRGD